MARAHTIEVGWVVQYVVNGIVSFWGVAEYVTKDGWVGIRQADGGLDEAPIKLVRYDPT